MSSPRQALKAAENLAPHPRAVENPAVHTRPSEGASPKGIRRHFHKGPLSARRLRTGFSFSPLQMPSSYPQGVLPCLREGQAGDGPKTWLFPFPRALSLPASPGCLPPAIHL